VIFDVVHINASIVTAGEQQILDDFHTTYSLAVGGLVLVDQARVLFKEITTEPPDNDSLT
jgi:hypothetical protein